MTLFEKVTESPEALGAFLTSLAAVNTPWEEHFQKTVCPECERYGKDCGSVCPHEDKRNNPTWWLVQAVECEPVVLAAPCGDTERQAVGFGDFSGLFSAEIAKSLGLKASRDTCG